MSVLKLRCFLFPLSPPFSFSLFFLSMSSIPPSLPCLAVSLPHFISVFWLSILLPTRRRRDSHGGAGGRSRWAFSGERCKLPCSPTVGCCNLPFHQHGKTGCQQKQTMIHISEGEDEFNMFICLPGYTNNLFYRGPVYVHKSLFVCLNCP